MAARVTNAGGFRGKETLQVYVSCPQGRLSREVKSLVGFAKTRELMPGESDEVGVTFDVRDFAGFEARGARYVLEQGRYVLLAGLKAGAVTRDQLARNAAFLLKTMWEMRV